MKKKLCMILAFCALLLTACHSAPTDTASQESYSAPESISAEPTAEVQPEVSDTGDNTNVVEQNAIGAMSPEDALAYMKETENLFIVDVATTKWYEDNHFEGAINIPIEELDSDEEDSLYMEIPSGVPVIIHCRLGMIAPGAYERVMELRPEIPEISYIDGKPLFDEYNEWVQSE